MSAKHEGIDLNADAVSADRENEGDAPVIGVSLAETLTEHCTGQVEKVRVFDSAKVICDLTIGGNDVNLNSEGFDREADVLGKVEKGVEKGSECFDRGVEAKEEKSNVKCGDDVSLQEENEVEKGSGLLDRRVDAKAEENNGKCGEDVSLRDKNEAENGSERLGRGVDAKADENNGKCGEDGSTHDEKEVEKGSEMFYRGVEAKAKENDKKCENEVEGAPVAVRASSEAEMHHDMNVGPVGKELDHSTHGRDTNESSHQKFEDATSDELEHKRMEIDTEAEPDVLEQETNNGDKVQPLHQKFEEATSDGLDHTAMAVDSQTKLECSEDQFVHVPVSEVQDSSNVLNKSLAGNLAVDLPPCMAKDGNASIEVNAKSVSSQSEFCDGDLVWGKVRSHPWWPGQIFDLSAASQKAKKYLKKNSYLIAYFGDQTFAWNDASKIKPFQEYFARKEKQTNLEDFHYAVDCILEEVDRRVKLGLACACIPEEAYAKIKNQIIVNAGIREESSTRDSRDHFLNAASFEPVRLSERIKALAQLPYNSEVDRLEFVTVKAQLSAFYHWKGYLQLPEFNMLDGLLESDAEIPLLSVKHEAELTQSSTPHFNGDKKASSDTGKLKSEGGSSHKRKHSSGDSIHPSKKEKTLSDLLAERRTNMSSGKRGTYWKGNELISLSSGKKRKSVNSISDDRVVKHKMLESISDEMYVKSKKLDSVSDDTSVKHKKCDMSVVKHEKGDFSVGAANKCLPIKKTFGVGNSILKAASQLNGSSPIFKSGDGTSGRPAVRNKSKEKSLFRKSQSKKQFPPEETSPAELLSQLCLGAKDPLEGYTLLNSLVSFFSEFRNSVCLEQSQEEVSGDKTGTWTNSGSTETSGSESMKETYWTERTIQNVPQAQQALENKNEAGEVLHESPSQRDTSPVEPTSAVPLSAHLESALQTAGETFEQEAVKPADPLDNHCSEDLCPTALVLNFTDLESVPSKENLNKIFSRFGPLNESETEVKKSKRAKVVFKRSTDAETAFSRAGKYSIFGPSLVSYCLKYMPCTPSKGSSRTKKQGKNAETSEGGNAS